MKMVGKYVDFVIMGVGEEILKNVKYTGWFGENILKLA